MEGKSHFLLLFFLPFLFFSLQECYSINKDLILIFDAHHCFGGSLGSSDLYLGKSNEELANEP